MTDPNVFGSSIPASLYYGSIVISSVSAYGKDFSVGLATGSLQTYSHPLIVYKMIYDHSFHWFEFFAGYFTYAGILFSFVVWRIVQWMLNDKDHRTAREVLDNP